MVWKELGKSNMCKVRGHEGCFKAVVVFYLFGKRQRHFFLDTFLQKEILGSVERWGRKGLVRPGAVFVTRNRP